MSTKAQYRSGILTYYDSVTFETVQALAPFWFKDDFKGATIHGEEWAARDTAGATEAVGANTPSGTYVLSLTAANEAQLAGLDWADQRNLTLNQGLCFESRVRLSTLPTTGTIVCVGLCGNHNAAVDTVAESIWFRLDGATGGLITVETDDTTGGTEKSKVTTGVTLLATDWVILRIDCTVIADVKFYVNGARVAASTTFDMSAVPTLALQPVVRVGKESAGTNLGVMSVDYIAVWQNRT